MKILSKVSSFVVCVALLNVVGITSASATTYVEDFEADFPAWESGWLGTQSDLTNYYGVGQGRGNNPDGLWIGKDVITFNPSFGSNITSLDIDVATWVDFTFSIYDMSNNVLLSEAVVPNYGAYTDPGTYWHYAVASLNGISRLEFSGSGVLGNTSIDNVVLTAVPEPETYAMLLAGLGLLGFMARRRKELTA